MDIELGRDRISSTQRRHLEHARRMLKEIAGVGRPPRHFLSLLNRVVDDDIRSGREQLHPEWQELYLRLFEVAESFDRSSVPDDFEEIFAPRSVEEGVGQIDPSDNRVVFLLGAGASKPEPSGIPTVNELLPDLLRRARRLDREDVQRLVEFCESTDIDDIEDLLTAAKLADFCSHNPAVLSLLEFLLYGEDERRRGRRGRVHGASQSSVELSSVAFLQDTLQVIFGLLSNRMLPAEPNSGHHAIADYVESHSRSTIVTTNYDCCMDLALGSVGQEFTYQMEFSNVDLPGDTANLPDLIKLHGSLNWFYCDTCQEVQLIDIQDTVESYKEDRRSYPVIAVCKDCGGQRRGLLVPPQAMKFDIAPPLNPLLVQAQRAFQGADVVVVVGFSFAEADQYITRMLTKWMQGSRDSRLIIFDSDWGLAGKIRKRFSRRIPNFKASRRILAVKDDCSDTLPEFLAGGYLDEEEDGEHATSRGEMGTAAGRES